MGIVEVNFFQYFLNNEQKDRQGISFSVEKGEIFSVLGRNGSGKTTLARHLNALLLPPEGTVFVCGLDASDEKNTSEIRKKCGMVFPHSKERFFTSNAAEEIRFALRCAGNDPEKAGDYLRLVGLKNRENDALRSLSEFDALCVQLASVLAAEPEIVILDDAASRIDETDREKYFSLLKKLRESGMTLILFTHLFEEAALAEKTLLLSEKYTVACGLSREVLTDRELLKKAGIELPFPLKVYYDLLESDIHLPTPPLNMRELVDEICL